MSQESNQPNQQQRNQPKYIEMLTPNDAAQYYNLRAALSSKEWRYNRGNRVPSFQEMLRAVKNFCLRGDEDDWKRCLVCGICWLPNGIAVNNRQFSLLLDKCKSSINGSLQRMGYGTVQSRQDSTQLLCDTIPYLSGKFFEMREWSVRQFNASTPQPNTNISASKSIPQFSSPAPHFLPSHNKPLSPVGNKWIPNPYGDYSQHDLHVFDSFQNSSPEVSDYQSTIQPQIYNQQEPIEQAQEQQQAPEPQQQLTDLDQDPFDDDDPFALEPDFIYD